MHLHVYFVLACRDDGYVPNSVLAKILFGKDEPEPEVDTWVPPRFSDSQRKSVAEYKRVCSTSHFIPSSMCFNTGSPYNIIQMA